ncbi:MAG: maleylacetate reductase [Alphaproteobacteria bacterium]|nr:maleylacetate reductase [Alphaproteobacteria bacterium]
MHSFTYDALPGRVVFGAGALDRLPDEVARLGAERALVLSTPRRGPAEEAAKRLGARAAGIFARAEMHVPVETARAARAEARRLGADACVAVGGGSTIGLGKAIALEFGLPILAVPTTYAGSEMTPIWGLTEGGAKRTGRDPKVLPRTVIYDPNLTLTLPAAIAGPSGINAIAHCVEALYAENANPITSLMAEEGVRALGRALPRVVAAPGDIGARSNALYGAWLAGTALGAVGMALHHKLCHTLGGSFGLPHAETHTIVLPHAAAYNHEAASEAMARIARALGVADAPLGLQDLARAVGAPLALKDIGMKEADLDRAAGIAAANPYFNPRPVERAALRRLLDDAFFGRAPAGA